MQGRFPVDSLKMMVKTVFYIFTSILYYFELFVNVTKQQKIEMKKVKQTRPQSSVSQKSELSFFYIYIIQYNEKNNLSARSYQTAFQNFSESTKNKNASDIWVTKYKSYVHKYTFITSNLAPSIHPALAQQH